METPIKSSQYEDLLRLFNTNIDGKYCLCLALTRIKGIGRRLAKVVCQKAGINPYIRAGEVTEEQSKILTTIISDPVANNIPVWFVNKRKELFSGKDLHINTTMFDQQDREELERLKRAKANRGLRLAAGLKVRGQRTKCTGRRHGVVGVARKK